MVEKTFVDVTDLFDVQRAEAQAALLPTARHFDFEELERLEQMKDRPIVYRTGLRRGLVPVGTSRPSFEEWEPIRIEQVAAVGRECSEIVLDSAVDRSEGRQQPGERRSWRAENFFAEAISRLRQRSWCSGGDRIVFPVDRIGHGQQIALFREEQKDQPHHQKQGGFVNIFFRDSRQEGAVAFAICPVERGHEHLDGPADLPAQRDGDFLLIFEAPAIQSLYGLFSRVLKSASAGKEIAEGAQGQAFVKTQSSG